MDFGIGIAPSSSNQSQSGRGGLRTFRNLFGKRNFRREYQDICQSHPSQRQAAMVGRANPYAQTAPCPSSGETSIVNMAHCRRGSS